MANKVFSELSDARKVGEAIKKGEGKEFSAICGALGTLEEPGIKMDRRDESVTAQAARYRRILTGQEKGKLGEKDYGHIAELIQSFIVGPKRTTRTAPEPKKKEASMNPSDLSRELNRIASAIDSSKSPSRELVIKELNRLVSRVAFAGKVVVKLDAGGAALEGLVEYALKAGKSKPEILGILKDISAGSIEALPDSIEGALDSIGDSDDYDAIENAFKEKLVGLGLLERSAGGNALPVTLGEDDVAFYADTEVPVDFADLEEIFMITQKDFDEAKAEIEGDVL